MGVCGLKIVMGSTIICHIGFMYGIIIIIIISETAKRSWFFFLPYYFSEIRKGAKFLSTDNVYNKFCRKFLKVNFRRSPFSRETAVLGQDMWWPCFGFNFTHNEFTHVFTVMDDYDVTKVPFSSVRWVQPGCHLAKEQPQHVCIIYWTTPEQGENKLQKKILAGHILWNVWRPDR